MLMEMGASPFCGAGCEHTLFGLESIGNKKQDVLLHSFDTHSDYVNKVVAELHQDHNTSTPLLEFTKLTQTITVNYTYAFNDTLGLTTKNQKVFYGEGGGLEADGYRIVVQETIGPYFAAPLELFWDKTGKLLTTYDTPVIYRHIFGWLEAWISSTQAQK